MEIGKIYRYSSEPDKMDPELKEVDKLPNYFYYTRDPLSGLNVMLNHGIQHIKTVLGSDGIERCPALIISSSPHRYGTNKTPWEDAYDPDFGHICYYGDNKTASSKPEDSPGNEMMLNAYRYHSAPSKTDRSKFGTPIVFFKRVIFDKRIKGNLMFQGFGIIESVEMVTQFDMNGSYFANFMFDLCVFDLKWENEKFDWAWINARRNPALSAEDTLKLAPQSWKAWTEKGIASFSEIRRKVSSLSIVKASDQQPVVKSKEEKLLYQIYDYYKAKRHGFEMLAMCITEHILIKAGIIVIPGWITSKSSDGGVDYVLRIDIARGLSGAKLIVLGQAKCEKPEIPTNGVHIARTVARLKRGWIGAYVTTSFFSSSVQREVIEDQYPIMLIHGKQVAETVRDILVKNGLSLQKFLQTLDEQYDSYIRARNVDEILRS